MYPSNRIFLSLYKPLYPISNAVTCSGPNSGKINSSDKIGLERTGLFPSRAYILPS